MQPIAPASVSAAVAPMRRLTRSQYRNTVRDLLGVADAVAPSALPGDDAIHDRFHSNTASPLQAIDIGKYADAAEAIAGKAAANLNGAAALRSRQRRRGLRPAASSRASAGGPTGGR